MFLTSIAFISSVAVGHAIHTQGYMCDVLNSSSSQIDEEVCPGVAGGAVTAEDCQDALHMLVNEAEGLLRCPGWNASGAGPTQAMKDAACVFVRREEVNRTEIINKICGEFNVLLKGSCVSFFQNGWTLYEASCADKPDERDAASRLDATRLTASSRFPGKEVACGALNNSASHIHDACPGITNGRDDMTLKDCEDGLAFVLSETETLLECSGINATGPGVIRLAEDAVCVFLRREEVDQSNILHHFCAKFGDSHLEACAGVLGAAWAASEASCADNVLRAAREAADKKELSLV